MLLRPDSRGATPSEDEIGQITAEASVFDKNAFTAAVNKIPEISQPEAETAFGTFDTHANGYMALADLTHVLANLGEGLNPDLIEKFKAAAEPDGEGQVNLRHFVDILYKGL